jgi:hypothetical protein
LAGPHALNSQEMTARPSGSSAKSWGRFTCAHHHTFFSLRPRLCQHCLCDLDLLFPTTPLPLRLTNRAR